MNDSGFLLATTAICLLMLMWGMAYAHQPTRRIAKKYGWLVLAFVLVLIGSLIGRRRRDDLSADAFGSEADRKIKDSMTAWDTLVEESQAKAAEADAELAVSRTENAIARKVFEDDLAEVKEIEDSLERRRALIALVERTKS